MEEAILKVNATLKDDIIKELKLKLRNLTHQAINRRQIKYLKSRLEKQNQHIDELFKKLQNLMQHHQAEIRKIKSESMKNETELKKQRGWATFPLFCFTRRANFKHIDYVVLNDEFKK